MDPQASSEAVSSFLLDEQNDARVGVSLASSTDPDMEAELRKVAQRTGVPISTVRSFPDEMKRRATVQAIDFADLQKNFPNTSKFLSNLDNAKVAHDDVDNLSAIEQNFREAQAQGRAVQGKVGELFQRPGDLRTSFGRVGETFIRRGQLAPDEGSFVGGLVGPEQFRSMSAGMSVQAADVLGLDPTQAIRNYEIARSRAQAAGPDIQSVTGRALYGGLQSTVSNLPGLAASVLTMNPLPGLAWAGLQSEGEAYGKYRARGATPLQATAGALGEGATEVATELIPMGFLAQKLGRAGLGEFITGFLAREMPTEQVATFVQDAIDTAVANPKKTWEQFWRERPQAAYETALSTLAQAGAIAGGGAALRRTVMRGQAEEYDAQQAQQQLTALQQVVQLAAASKVRERDASTFEGFMQSATEDGPLEKLYINPKDLQAAGIDLTQLAAVAPTTAAQIEQALQTGQDVAIPTSELMTRLPGSELEQSLVEHLKTDPGGFSAAGAKVYMQSEAAEQQRRDVQKVLAEHMADSSFKASMLVVEQNVRDQLAAANRFTEDVHGPYAALWANFFGVQAARLKVMPEDLFNRFAPRIVAQSPVSTSPLLDQPAFHGSPHDFERFSTAFMGTGEGAQAFGHGLYFAENRAVAEGYQRQLSGPQFDYWFGGKKVEGLTGKPPQTPEQYAAWKISHHGTPEAALQALAPNLPTGVPLVDKGAAIIRRAAQEPGHMRAEQTSRGKLYQVEIPDEVVARMLLWDKPLSEQPQNVRDAFDKIEAGIRDMAYALTGEQDPSGQAMYRALSESLAKPASEDVPGSPRGWGAVVNTINDRVANDRAASEMLDSLGVPGIKFLDQGSRVGGDGTHNLVVFNDKNVEITHKDGSPVTPAERREFFQGAEQGAQKAPPRGTFNPETNTIALLKAANLSTFLHESSHFFLEVLDDLAAQPDAPQQIKDDFAAFLRWTGVEAPEAAEGDKSTQDERRAAAWRAMTLDEKRPHHEDFARGFEAYLFEGKAPSVEMRGMFQRFRAWLLNVYRDISALNITLNKEIRGVFDRMLATTEQIQMAEDVRGYEALFRNKPEGMTDDEWSVYQIQANEATQQAITELEARSLGDMKWLAGAKSRELKRLQNEAAARRKEVEAEVRAEVEAMPVYQAIAAIKEQRKSDPQDRQAVKDWQAARDAEQTRLAEVVKGELLATPEGAASKGIQRGQFLARNRRQMANEVERLVLQWERNNPRPKVSVPAADLEQVAALSNGAFTSGDHVRQAIEAAAPMKDVIESTTDQRMLERYGDLTDPQAMERAAEEAIHNDARLRFVVTEANALRKAIGQPALLAKAIRQFAADIVARTRVRDLTPALYTSAEKRAGRDAERAMREGKTEDAAVQKRNQLINGHAAKLTLEAQAEARKIVDYLRRLNRDSAFKGIDKDYVDQIHALLERFDLRPASNVALDKRASLKAWLDEQAQQGIEPDIPPELVEQANRTHFKNLTMEQLRGLQDTVKQIEHLGRLKKKLLTAKDQRDYEAIRDSIVQSIHDNAGGKFAENRTRADRLDKAITLFNGYVLSHRKTASLVKEMDGFKEGGTFWEYFIRPMNAAGDREATLRAEAAKRLLEIASPILTIANKSTFTEGAATSEDRARGKTGSSFRHEERLGVALNMGNASNLQRLLDGEGWTLAQVKLIVDPLTAAEWKFVQGVWDFMESYRPLIAAKERRVYGKEPEWIERHPLTVQTADGKTISLEGGYLPVRYDPRRSRGGQEQDDAAVARQMMGSAFTSTTTRRSFTKTRAEKVTDRPLLYSLDALFNGVNEVIHDLSWHEYLIDANKLLRSTSINNAIRDRYGHEVLEQLRKAVKDIASGEAPATSAPERLAGRVRVGTMVSVMALNITNSLINVVGVTQSWERIGAKWITTGVLRYGANPMSLAREVNEKSAFMANRAQTINREVNEIQSMVRKRSTVGATVNRIMFLPLTMTQQIVDLPTWWGGYQKALDEGNADDRAIALADQAVLDAQSGGQIKDLAQIQRGGPAMKLWTTLYGFFSSTYNLNVEAVKRTEFTHPLEVVGLMGSFLRINVIPIFFGLMLKNLVTGGDWDWDRLGKKLVGDGISFMLSQMIYVREFSIGMQALTKTADFGTDYAGPAGARIISEITKLATQAGQGEVDTPFLKHLNNVLGMLLHYPAGQINRTVEGVTALNEGRTENPLAVVTGPPPKH